MEATRKNGAPPVYRPPKPFQSGSAAPRVYKPVALGPRVQPKAVGNGPAAIRTVPPPVYRPRANPQLTQTQRVATLTAKTAVPAFCPFPSAGAAQQKRAFTIQRMEGSGSLTTSKYQISGHKCTGYNEYHLDTNPQPKRKGRPITKAPKSQLDEAVVAINTGQTTFIRTDGRNDYVEYKGYIYGLHKQVFEGKRQLFPEGPVSPGVGQTISTTVTTTENFEEDDVEDEVQVNYSSKPALYQITQSGCQLTQRGGTLVLAFGTSVRVLNRGGNTATVQVLNGNHQGEVGTVSIYAVTELDY